MISGNSINLVIDKASIVDVISGYVSLKKVGSVFKSPCPFHNEKTASFTVSEKKGIYKCFGCGKGGNVINFIKEIESIDFRSAAKLLAETYNIELEYEGEEAEVLELDIYKANLKVAVVCNKELESNTIAKEYLSKLGYGKDESKKFMLGYCPLNISAFLNNDEKELLIESGFLKRDSSGTYSPQQGRFMFPIQDGRGRVVGFGGRDLTGKEKVAKYINSSESPTYHKSKILYGFVTAKTSIKQKDFAIIVEGYTDCITMQMDGYKNTVASCGTALTTNQIQLIKRFTNRIVLLRDGDKAGNSANVKDINTLLKEEIEVKIGILPVGEDPHSAIKKGIKHKYQSVIKYLFSITEGDEYDKTKACVAAIKLVSDGLYRSLLIKELSDIAKLPLDVVTKECGSYTEKAVSEAKTTVSELESASIELLSILLCFGSYEAKGVLLIDYVLNELNESDTEYKYKEFIVGFKNASCSPSYYLETEGIPKECVEYCLENEVYDGNKELLYNAAFKSILIIVKHSLKSKIDILVAKILVDYNEYDMERIEQIKFLLSNVEKELQE